MHRTGIPLRCLKYWASSDATRLFPTPPFPCNERWMLVGSTSRFEPGFPLREFPIVILSSHCIPAVLVGTKQLFIRQRSVVIEAGPLRAQPSDVSQRNVWPPLLPRRFSRNVRR